MCPVEMVGQNRQPIKNSIYSGLVKYPTRLTYLMVSNPTQQTFLIMLLSQPIINLTATDILTQSILEKSLA